MKWVFFFLSYSLVGKAFSVRSVCAWEAHVLWGWGPVYFPRQETVCPLVLCHSREVPHLHPSISSGRKLWVICTPETVTHRVCVSMQVSFQKKWDMYKIFYSISQRCMVESKNSRSRFIPHKANAVRFSVDAFMFKEISSQVSTYAERRWSFVVLFSYSLTQCIWIMTKLVIFCNLIIFMSSSCTAVCQWAALPQLLQLSPATTTTKERGFILIFSLSFLKDLKFSGVFLTAKYHILVIVPFRWVELYGSDSVCACCESTCSSASSMGESCSASLYH